MSKAGGGQGRAGQGRAGSRERARLQTEYVQIQSARRRCSSYCHSCRRGWRVPSQALLATALSRASPEARCRGGERGSQRGSEGKWRMSQAGPEKRRIKATCELSQAPARLCPGPGAAWHPGHEASRELEGAMLSHAQTPTRASPGTHKLDTHRQEDGLRWCRSSSAEGSLHLFSLSFFSGPGNLT